MNDGMNAPAPPPTRGALLATSLKIGLLSFGGAAGQIAMMHRIYVDEKRWVSERDYINGLNFCTLLPGPEAQQLATYIGWRLHGVLGGLVSGILFILPGAAIMLALAQAYVLGAGIPIVAGLLLGIKAAVIAIIAEAVIKLARRALGGPAFRLMALAAFVAMSFTAVPFPVVIIAAALGGVLITRGHAAQEADEAPPPLGRVALAAGSALAAWWLPVILAWLLLGGDHLLVEIGLFFSKLAVITFGGAYAVIAYLAEEGVKRGWADTRQMIDALGLAETTPGPTILVNPFIAFLAGDRAGGTPMAWLAGLMALWTTFAPSFLWIFAGGPMLSRFARNPALAGALRGISAAVVGIIATVALRFAIVLFFAEPKRVESWPFGFLAPGGAPDLTALALAALALVLLFGLRWPMLRMLGLVAAFGASTALFA
jgi:chromate transporter